MTVGRVSAGGRAAAVFTIVLLVSALATPSASAHGFLERSEPPNGGTIAVGRSSLTLWFSEPISAEASKFDLHTLDGIQAGISVTTAASDNEGFVEIETGPLLKATYLLDWSVLSLDDGHRYSGSVLFGVGARPEVDPFTSNGIPDKTNLLFRWLDLSLLMLVIGSLAVSGRVLGSMGSAGIAYRGKALFIGALAATGAALTGAITPFLRMPRGGSSLYEWFEATSSMLTGTSWGRLWIAREIALVALVVLICLRVFRRNQSEGQWPLAALPLAAVIGLGAWAGHAAALPRASRLAAMASASHLAAAGVWAGGLILLALVLFPVIRKHPDARGPILASAFRAYSPMAGVASGVLVATGLYQSGRHVPDVGSAFSTVYGGAVVAKIALVGVALLLAGINTMLINPNVAAPVGRLLGRPEGWSPVSLRRFTSVVLLEGMVLMLAVGVAALATSVPTALEIASSANQAAPQRVNVDGLFVSMEVVPAGSSQSRLIVRAGAVIRPQPGPINEVLVTLDGPDGSTTNVSLNPTEPGRYEAKTDELTSGIWDATVTVQRNDTSDAIMRLRWDVAEADPDQARPLEQVATLMAIFVFAMVLAAIRRFRRPRNDPEPTMSRQTVTTGRT